ncbi:Mpo1-like protein [Rapidithrix thailandica]|uniref:Mpo1-like protein n=1 Tax=Rapidithrix thailandica TaxID=413964 RepID=A0AAW9SFZ0_9BACT
MKTIQDWFNEYGESHQNKLNKLMHWICIPIIFVSVIGLLASIPSGFLARWVPESMQSFAHFGTVVIVLGLLFYLRLSFRMFLGMALVCFLSLLAVNALVSWGIAPLWMLSLLLFLVGWIGQFYGHKVEGKKPSFFKDIQFLLIGPAWLLGFIYRKLGLKY